MNSVSADGVITGLAVLPIVIAVAIIPWRCRTVALFVIDRSIGWQGRSTVVLEEVQEIDGREEARRTVVLVLLFTK